MVVFVTKITFKGITYGLWLLIDFPGVRLYQGLLTKTIPNYAMLAGRDFDDEDVDSDGLNDGLWCQSAMNVSGIGSWKLPDGNAVSDDSNHDRIYMANRPGQVGLLRTGKLYVDTFPYLGMYTCTIPDENGVSQTLVVWAGGIPAYDGTNNNRELKITLHDLSLLLQFDKR